MEGKMTWNKKSLLRCQNYILMDIVKHGSLSIAVYNLYWMMTISYVFHLCMEFCRIDFVSSVEQ